MTSFIYYMQPSELEIILTDFRKTIDAVKRIRSKEEDLRDTDWERGFFYSVKIRHFSYDETTGIAWWGATEGFTPEFPAGRPEDYVRIRDDYDELKAFIGTTLDRGQVHESYGTHGAREHNFSFSEYIIWLYTFSEHDSFKKNVERAVVELLDEELDRDFTDGDTLYQRARELLLDQIDRRHNGDVLKAAQFIDKDSEGPLNRRYYLRSIAEVLSVIGLENLYGLGERELTDSENKLKIWFEQNMAGAVRSETLEEWGSRFYGEHWEEKREEGRVLYDRERIAYRPVLHGQEVSDDVKKKYAEKYLEFWPTIIQKNAKTLAYDRLTGLLEVISGIGKPHNGFAGSYETIKQKAEAGVFKDVEDIPRGYHHSQNIFNHLLLALGAVQHGDELRDFWLSNIRDDNNGLRVITSVREMLRAYKIPEERRMHISEILQILHERRNDLDQSREEYCGLGIKTVKVWDVILNSVADLCYERGTFTHFDRETATLDALVKLDIHIGQYSFTFHRSTPTNSTPLSATYNLQTDSLEGDTALDPIIRAYFKQGYPVPDDVTVTSLESRRIDHETKVLEMSDDLKGKYEGVIGISGTHFPFLYDPETGDVQIGKPIHFTSYFSGYDWETSRFGFDNVTQKTPSQTLVGICNANELVADSISTQKQRYIFDSTSLLGGKDFSQLGPYITALVRSKMDQ